MNVLLFSNGKSSKDAQPLSYGYSAIEKQSNELGIKKYLFIPYAVIRSDYSSRTKELAESMKNINIEVECISDFDDPVEAVKKAEGIMVSGGNTWFLNKTLHDKGLINPIREVVINKKVGYVGWSAGSNIACPSIVTTNDMPVITEVITHSLNLIPFQINAHYIDSSIDGHMGETRDERIEEVLSINKHMTVVGLREGCYLEYNNNELRYHTKTGKNLRLFKYNKPYKDLTEKDSLDFILR